MLQYLTSRVIVLSATVSLVFNKRKSVIRTFHKQVRNINFLGGNSEKTERKKISITRKNKGRVKDLVAKLKG